MRKDTKAAIDAAASIERERETKRLISDINYDILKMRQELQSLRTQYDRMRAELQKLRQEVNACRK